MQRLSDEFRSSLEQLAQRQEEALGSGSPVLSYLAKRGIGESAAKRFRLGQGVDDYAGKLAIPYLTKLGGVVSIKYRQIQDGAEPKYLTPPGYPARLYNTVCMGHAEYHGYIGIAEGEIDTITLSLCGIYAVGIPGVDNWKAHPEWRELFRGFSRVLVFADTDDPGRGLAERICHDIDTATVVSLPGNDVNETYLKYGRDEIRRRAGLDV